MLSCGHGLCCRCCDSLERRSCRRKQGITRRNMFSSNQTEINKIKCPTCRQATPVEELAHACAGNQSMSLDTRDASQREQSMPRKSETEMICDFPGEECFVVEGSYGTKVKPTKLIPENQRNCLKYSSHTHFDDKTYGFNLTTLSMADASLAITC